MVVPLTALLRGNRKGYHYVFAYTGASSLRAVQVKPLIVAKTWVN